MLQKRLAALAVFVIGAGVGWFVYSSQLHAWRPFRLGLDLSGGTQLIYKADVSQIPSSDTGDSMAALRDTIERRVNLFGVAEPLVETETGSSLAGLGSEQRLVVELPGVTDVAKAVALIGQTPVLEFRLLKPGTTSLPATTTPAELDRYFEPASITGKDLSSAELQFEGQTGSLAEPVVVLHFDSAGTAKFAQITKENVGRVMGIFLDGQPISTPVIREAIPDGTALISGNFTPDSAKTLARNLNYGALPLPISLVSTQSVSGTLGTRAVESGVFSGLIGVAAVALFMLLWYRLPGIIASVALLIYIAIMLALFMLIPVTLTAAGIAGFILSIGMAVDANILIFERTKEELRELGARDAIDQGFKRAWPSIRDSNISSMITAAILFWFGTSLIKGFALVFFLGVLVSMLTAISVSRTFLMALGVSARTGATRFLFGSGMRN